MRSHLPVERYSSNHVSFNRQKILDRRKEICQHNAVEERFFCELKRRMLNEQRRNLKRKEGTSRP